MFSLECALGLIKPKNMIGKYKNIKMDQKSRKQFIKILREGKEIPSSFKNILFPQTKKEYELVYDGKERKEDILAETMRVPFQPIKTFGADKKIRKWLD